MTVKKNWKKFRKIFNQLELRERQLIISSACVTIIAIFFMAFWNPMYQQWVKASVELDGIKQNINVSRIDIETIKKNSKLDANKPYRDEIAGYHQKIDKQQKIIETITAALISPKNMNNVFSALLQNKELEVNKINNKKAEPIIIKDELETESLLFKHALTLEMTGTFSGSKKYLERIENQDWNLYWNELKFTATRYPQGILTLNVHTLSTSDYVFGL
jgi:MSHA biogenesis protein MshJ